MFALPWVNYLADDMVCDQGAPLVYFKLVPQIEPEYVLELYRQFWNLGGAPILALVSPRQVQIYSALSRPNRREADEVDNLPSLVITLDRASSALREFLPAVESGEFFRKHSRSFDPSERVDQSLLRNLQAARDKLASITTGRTT
ncbi:MAG: hypothetical protein Q7O66_22295, partial [Dehalococcoidia bacterium]|nr:hypothetical protein [Dehalococcoidia bacterium]